MRAEARAAVALVLAAGLLGGCTSGAEDQPGAAASPGRSAATPARYVALGDSFTAAPYVPDTDLAGGCFRSTGNYPNLVARQLELTLVDVSCSGADTVDLLRGQTFAFAEATVPPQVEALTRDTGLVTVTIGGNDGALFQTLVHECTRVADAATTCEDLVSTRHGEPEEISRHLAARVAGVLDRIRRAAPEARVVLVGYPRLTAVDRSCPALPLAAPDRRFLARVERALQRAHRASARRAGVDFLDMHAASRGHEVCSDEPWVNGARTDEARALAFHPFAAGQRAVADRLVELLR